MKNILLTALAFILFCPLLHADNDQLGRPVPVDLQWESLSQGMQLAWELEFLSTNQKYRLAIYLKNTSNSAKYFTMSGRDRGFRFFYTDSQGVQHDLHSPSMVVSASTFPLKTGQVVHLPIDLDSADLAILKANPIQCSIQLGQVTTDESTLTSSPRQFSVSQ